jgi:hypothetical protein
VNDPRYEPSADARAFAKQIRDWYLALLAEGFTEAQALTILGTLLAAQIQNGGS